MSAAPSRHRAEIDLRSINDTQVMAIGRVPANSRVLDLGLADGSVAQILREMGCRVWGVDLDPGAADLARDICEKVVVAELNTVDLAEHFRGLQFDVVLMLDVLEHLRDPAALLRKLPPLLADRGWGVVSLPNVAHASLRLNLLKGHFTYTDAGLLDRNNLRFFDRSGVDDLLAQAGWEMFDLARVTRALGTTEIQPEEVDPELARQFESDIEALTYQFVLTFAPLGSDVLEHHPLLPAAAAQSALLEATDRIAELDEEVRRLRQQHLPDLMDQLDDIRARIFERQGHLKSILLAISENSERLGGAEHPVEGERQPPPVSEGRPSPQSLTGGHSRSGQPGLTTRANGRGATGLG